MDVAEVEDLCDVRVGDGQLHRVIRLHPRLLGEEELRLVRVEVLKLAVDLVHGRVAWCRSETYASRKQRQGRRAGVSALKLFSNGVRTDVQPCQRRVNARWFIGRTRDEKRDSVAAKEADVYACSLLPSFSPQPKPHPSVCVYASAWVAHRRKVTEVVPCFAPLLLCGVRAFKRRRNARQFQQPVSLFRVYSATLRSLSLSSELTRHEISVTTNMLYGSDLTVPDAFFELVHPLVGTGRFVGET